MSLTNRQLQSLYESIDGMTSDGARALGEMLDMGSPSLPDYQYRKSVKDDIQIELICREKLIRRFGDPRWGR